MNVRISRLGAVVGAAVMVVGVGSTTLFAQGPIYSNIPTPLPADFITPDNNTSIGFEAYGASEFGGIVQPDLTNGSVITSATVVLSNWAYESLYNSYVTATPTISDPSNPNGGDPNANGYGANSLGYYVPLTLSLYNVNSDGSVGSVIATDDIDAFIDWRPPSNGCLSPDGSNDGYQIGGTGTCYGGDAQAVQFSFDAPVSGDFIYGLSFDTQDYGSDPTGVDGPYDSLNLALTLDEPSTGVNPALDGCADGPPESLPSTDYCDSAYWANSTGLTGSGTTAFAQDTGWISGGYGSAVVEFDATSAPEPGTLCMIGFGLVGLAFVARRKVQLPAASRDFRA